MPKICVVLLSFYMARKVHVSIFKRDAYLWLALATAQASTLFPNFGIINKASLENYLQHKWTLFIVSKKVDRCCIRIRQMKKDFYDVIEFLICKGQKVSLTLILFLFLKWQPCHFPVMAFAFLCLIYLQLFRWSIRDNFVNNHP